MMNRSLEQRKRPINWIVAISLLLFGQVAVADCTRVIPQSVKFEPIVGNSVEHDPFAPQPSTLIITAQFDRRCDSVPSARLYWKDTGIPPGKVPSFEIVQDGKQVFVTDGHHTLASHSASSTRPIIFQQVGSGDTVAATLMLIPRRKNSSARAEKPGRISLQILAVFQTAALLENSNQTLFLDIETQSVGKLSLVDTINHAGKFAERDTIDMGEITTTGVALRRNLWIWNNTSSIIEASSETNWLLVRNGGFSSGTGEIPFNISLTNSLSDELLKMTDGVVLRTGTMDETSVDGDRYTLSISVAEGASKGKRAGHYRGSVTITVRPRQ